MADDGNPQRPHRLESSDITIADSAGAREAIFAQVRGWRRQNDLPAAPR